ncbi:MAG TPA: ADOP family duplicated permease [Gemmatimonadaceae bacterium]|nr:ADOP family duplicated permease [Gemmatimonadaceae bacterium]
MRALHALVARLRATFTAGRVDREFDEELLAHFEMLVDDLRRAGYSNDDARREAARKLGRLDPLREDHRNQRGYPALDLVVQSLRHALRRLAKTPGFAIVVALTLALGIGANTALFSLVDNLLLRSLPVRDPDQLVRLQVFLLEESGRNTKPHAPDFGRAVFASVRAEHRIVEDVVGYQTTDRAAIAIDGVVQRERAVDVVSPNFFTALGVRPVAGRWPDTSDVNVAAISERWWRSQFGGAAGVLGRTITIDGKNYAIVGVAAARFHGFDLDRSVDAWIAPASGPLMMVARLQSGVTPKQAELALHRLLIEEVDARERTLPMATEALPVGSGLSGLRDQYRGALLALMGLVTLVLLATCANVGNLVMLRNTARRRELALRAALGASRSRLIGISLGETALLGVAGCIGGLLLARIGVAAIVAMLPLPAPPDALTFHADVRVLGFAAGTCMLGALLFGVAPALRATDVNFTGWLQSSHGLTAPARTRQIGRFFVGAQVALSVLLLVGAGLFVQTLRNLSRLHVGFSTEQTFQLLIDSRFAGYDDKDVPALSQTLLARLNEVPGVRAASRTRNRLMMGTTGMSMGIRLPGISEPIDNWDGLEVGPQFFETMGLTLLRGRLFVTADFVSSVDPRRSAEAARAYDRGFAGPLIVNESFVKRYFPGTDPLAAGPRIVGVVKDAKLLSVKDDVRPLMFLASPRPPFFGAVQVRAVGDAQAIEKAIRRAVSAVHPQLLSDMSTLGEVSARSIAKERMVATISGFFSVLGLVLAAIGIFGIASSAVGQRTKELGIRRALGAGRWVLVREALRESFVVFGFGLSAGALAAFIAVRWTSSFVGDLLYGLTATDAINFLTAIGAMVVVAVAACTIPAVRATRVDPLLSIRQD